VEASNKLLAEYTKYDEFLNNCPYWLGTLERIENGERFIYEKEHSKTSDGYDLITFRKTRANGEVVEERQYKIVGTEPQLIKE
jgi:bla regulator protein BlaR1